MASTADESAVAELSAKTFTAVAFNNDPLLSPETCQNVYRQWASIVCADSGSRRLAAESQGLWLGLSL